MFSDNERKKLRIKGLELLLFIKTKKIKLELEPS